MITRRATWLRAALYYSENLAAVHMIVNSWTGEGLLVNRAKEATNMDGLVPDLVRINQYRTLATNVELLAGVEINFFNNLPIGQVITNAYLPVKISTCPKQIGTVNFDAV